MCGPRLRLRGPTVLSDVWGTHSLGLALDGMHFMQVPLLLRVAITVTATVIIAVTCSRPRATQIDVTLYRQRDYLLHTAAELHYDSDCIQAEVTEVQDTEESVPCTM